MTDSVLNSMNNGKIRWPSGPSMKQYFPFRENLIYYITQNPSTPKCYYKMIQSCKHFFENCPIHVITNIEENIICSNENCTLDCCLTIDINTISGKFWFFNKLLLFEVLPINTIASLRPKVYRCEIYKLGIHKTKISFDDFKFLSAIAKSVYLTDVEMMHDNGKPVMVETILESLPNVVKFVYECKRQICTISDTTMKNISILKNLSHLRKIVLFFVPAFLNLEDLISFSKIHQDIKISLYYNSCNMSQEYKNQLDAIINAGSQHPNLFVHYKCWALPYRGSSRGLYTYF